MPFFVPDGNPVRIFSVVKAAGNELTGLLGKPEGLAGVPGHRNRSTVLDGNTEDLGFAAE
jgi:hypothetical protein